MHSSRNATLSEKITRTKEGMRKWQQERVIFGTTERLCELLEEHGITRAELATFRKNEPHKGDLSIKANYVLDYTIASIDHLSEEHLEAFSKLVGIYNDVHTLGNMCNQLLRGWGFQG